VDLSREVGLLFRHRALHSLKQRSDLVCPLLHAGFEVVIQGLQAVLLGA
jgi:hypothetical protein